MRISDLHIDGFGVWSDLSIEKLSPEVTAFYGPNEAGKTTLMQFLRSVLYGMSAHRRQRYLPPLRGGRPGGWLKVDGEDGTLQIKRVADRGPNDVGKVTVVTADGDEHGDRLLRESLENVDEVTFNNVFAVGLQDIQELGTLDGTAAAQWLYRLTSGLDRVSLYDVIHLLRGSLARLLNVVDEESELRTLLTRREVLDGEMQDLVAKGRRWAQSAVKLRELAEEIEELQDESKRVASEARRLETAINLKPLWTKREGLDEQIAAFELLPKLPDGAIDQLADYNLKIEEHDRQRDVLKRQRHQLRDEADGLGINELLVANSCRLCGLEEQQTWLEALQGEVEDLEEKVDANEQRIESEHERLSARWLAEGIDAEHVTPELLEQLEPQAQAIEATEQLVERAREQLTTRHETELHHRSQLEKAAASGDKRGLPSDIQEASELVASLRQRRESEQRVDKSQKAIRDLEHKNYELAESQLMPLDWFMFLVVVAAVSSGLLGARLFDFIDPGSSLDSFAGWAGGLGLAGCVFAVFWKYFQQELSADRLDEWFLQMEDAERELKEAKKLQQQFMRDLPMARESVNLRLDQAEKHLAELEQALPVEHDRRAAEQEIEGAELRVQQARQKHQAAWNNWKNKLQTLGLSEAVTPTDLSTILRQYEKLEQLTDRNEALREEAERRGRDYDAIARRIQGVAEEAGLVLEDEDASPLDQLSHLLEADREQKARLKHRDTLRERAAELKAQEGKHARTAQGFRRRREALFSQCSVDSEEGLRHLAGEHDQCAKLKERRQALCREITAAIGRRGEEEDFATLLGEEVIGRLESNWESLGSRAEQIEAQLKELLQERGSLVEQQRRQADDRSLGLKQIEIDEVDLQIQKVRDEWRERAVVYYMLEKIRYDYEKNRQPETLLEASEYMRKLTSGRYSRIWTPLADDVLMIDTADGQSLPVEVLSTGTREQIYVSLRMAMVAMYARRGIQLPMILDDVFVNFDVGRTRIAIEVLQEFARQGHQLLVFTCHEHVWRMFQEIDADARRLPDRFNNNAEPETIEREEPTVVDEQAVEFILDEQPVEEKVVEEIVEVKEKPKKKRRRKPAPEPVEPEPLPEYEYDFGEPITAEQPPEYEYELQSEASEYEVEYSWPEPVVEAAKEEQDAWLAGEDYREEARPLLDPIVEPYASLRNGW